MVGTTLKMRVLFQTAARVAMTESSCLARAAPGRIFSPRKSA